MITVLLGEVDLRKRTERLYIEGRYEEALASAREGIEYYKVHAINYFWVAECLMRLERFEEALEMFYIGRDREPNSAGSYRRIAEPLIRMQRYDEALTALQRAKTLAPQDVNTYLRSVDVHKLLGDKASIARELVEAYQALEPASEALLVVADHQFHHGLNDDAIQTFKKSQAVGEGHPEYRIKCAELLARAGNFDEAYSILHSLINSLQARQFDSRVVETLYLCGRGEEARQYAENIPLDEKSDIEQVLKIADLSIINQHWTAGFRFYERGISNVITAKTILVYLFKCLVERRPAGDRSSFFKLMIGEAEKLPENEFKDVLIAFLYLQRGGAFAKSLMRMRARRFSRYGNVVNLIEAECWRKLLQYRRSAICYEKAVLDYPEDASLRRVCTEVVGLAKIESARCGILRPVIFHDNKKYQPPKSVDLLYKTYKPDEEWLQYAILSAKKNIVGIRNIIVLADEGDNIVLPNLDNIVYREFSKPLGPPMWGKAPGYSWQMGLKLSWTDVSDADAALILDSDCMVCRPMNVEELYRDGGPAWYYRSWEAAGEGVAWKSAVDYFLGMETAHGHMCRNGFFLTREATEGFRAFMREQFNQTPLEYVMDSSRIFSACEYEMFGAYLHYVERHGYTMKDTQYIGVENWPFLQYWSWGGLSEDVRKELKELIGS
ncbi:tetratricopeptide repeat protein [Asticcacaulis sp.]|uniref:tetratricopeptide repeat protein n=1 Tax=Asticcacaulis sp. TaxID=1872648 RepID=UPI002637AD57|nr:tetratricopeptide repeat protein [Asticcacaulis sp.]